MTFLNSVLARNNLQKSNIDLLALDRDDYKNILMIKKWEEGLENPNAIYTAYLNFTINIYEKNKRRIECMVFIDNNTEENTENRIIAREYCRILRSELPQEDWLFLMQWFLNGGPNKKTSTFFRRLNRIKEKCIEIFNCHQINT